jgi:hypothetical protein
MTYTSPLDGATFDEPARYHGEDGPLEHYLGAHAGKPRADLTARRSEIITRTAELESYGRRSQAQSVELNDLIAEQIAVDDLIKRADVEIRRAKIEEITRIAQDPANLERPDGGKPGAPALVKGLGDRAETASEIMQRAAAGNPWAVRSDPLAGHTSYGRATPAPG